MTKKICQNFSRQNAKICLVVREHRQILGEFTKRRSSEILGEMTKFSWENVEIMLVVREQRQHLSSGPRAEKVENRCSRYVQMSDVATPLVVEFFLSAFNILPPSSLLSSII